MQELGLSTKVHSINNIDGDTVRVTVLVEFDVRLLPETGRYDAPEISHPKNAEEKRRGLEVEEYLRKKLTEADIDDITVFIPFRGRGKIGDNMTLNRPKGKIYIKGENVIDEKMIRDYSK